MTEPALTLVTPTAESLTTKPVITEDCPDCLGTGRRFRLSAANPPGEDIGACPVCGGSGKIIALGVTHVAEGEQPASVEVPSPETPAVEAPVEKPVPTPEPATEPTTPEQPPATVEQAGWLK